MGFGSGVWQWVAFLTVSTQMQQDWGCISYLKHGLQAGVFWGGPRPRIDVEHLEDTGHPCSPRGGSQQDGRKGLLQRPSLGQLWKEVGGEEER